MNSATRRQFPKARVSLTRAVLAALGVALSLFAGAALADPVEVLWLGHAAFRITSPTGKVIVIDPLLKLNPRTPAKYKDLTALGKVDLILVTHGHDDHVRDVGELAKLTGAKVVANYDLASTLVALGIVDGSKSIAMNKGGTVAPLGPGIKIYMVPAEHSSSSTSRREARRDRVVARRRRRGGRLRDRVRERIQDLPLRRHRCLRRHGLDRPFHKLDLALVCIGGYFTMDPEHAAFALRELLRPKQVIPMHYGTFPVINRTPAEFKAALGNSPIKVLDVKPGDALQF